MKTGWLKQAAQSMVEFALILPLLLLVILGIFAFGHFMFVYVMTTSASREAARYGAVVGLSENNIERFRDCKAIRDAAMRIGGLAGLNANDIYIYYYDNSTKIPDVETAPIAHCNPTDSTPGAFTAELGQRLQVRVTTHYVPLVPFVNLPSFPIDGTSIRSIIRDVQIGTAEGAGHLQTATPPSGNTSTPSTAVPVTLAIDQPNSVNLANSIVAQEFDMEVKYTLSSASAPPPATASSVQVTINGWTYPCATGAPSGNTRYGFCTVSFTNSAGNTFQKAGLWQVRLDYYSPDPANFQDASTSVNHQTQYETATMINPPADTTVVVNGPVNLTIFVDAVPNANADAENKRPIGKVSIVDAGGNVLAGPTDVVASGTNYRSTVNFTIAFASEGTKDIKAVFTPDPTNGQDFLASESGILSLNIIAPNAPLVVSLSATSLSMGQTLTVNFHLDLSGIQNAPDPNGTVQVTMDGVTPCNPSSLTMPRNGGSCTFQVNAVGSHTIETQFAYDSHYPAQMDVQSINVTPGVARFKSGSLTHSPEPSSRWLDTTFNWVVEPATSGLPAPTGAVTVRYDGANYCTGNAPTGSCAFKIPQQDPNLQAQISVTVYISYGGDANYAPIAEQPLTVKINPCPEFDINSANVDQNNKSFSINLKNINYGMSILRIDYAWPSNNINQYLYEAHILAPAAQPGQCNNNSTTCLWKAQGSTNVPSPFCLSSAGPCTLYDPNKVNMTVANNAITKFLMIFRDAPALLYAGQPYYIKAYLNIPGYNFCPAVDITIQ